MKRGDLADFAKWVFTFFLLSSILWWARFLVLTLKETVAQPSPANIVELAGVSALLGAMIGWMSTIVFFWFRKRSPVEPSPPSTPPATTGPPTPPP